MATLNKYKSDDTNNRPNIYLAIMVGLLSVNTILIVVEVRGSGGDSSSLHAVEVVKQMK